MLGIDDYTLALSDEQRTRLEAWIGPVREAVAAQYVNDRWAKFHAWHPDFGDSIDVLETYAEIAEERFEAGDYEVPTELDDALTIMFTHTEDGIVTRCRYHGYEINLDTGEERYTGEDDY
jgi:hypothetical protein